MQPKARICTVCEGSSIVFLNHPELNLPGRVEKMLKQAERILAGGDGLAPEDEAALFKALHACGYAIQRHRNKSRCTRRSEKSLKALRGRIVDYLVNQNIGLIYEMRRRSRIMDMDPDELFSEGLWTLFRAVTRFDPWRGFRFSTYACTSILRGFVLFAKRRHRQEEVRKQLREETEQLDGNGARDHSADYRVELMIDRLQNILEENAADLTDTERFVIERRMLHPRSARPTTLEAIGKMINLSKERVRQIQITALEKLREEMVVSEAGRREESGGEGVDRDAELERMDEALREKEAEAILAA